MELVPVGYFSKPHGVKGQLVLRGDVDLDTGFLRVLFVQEKGGGQVPHFIAAIADSPKGYLVTLEDIDSVEAARVLVGSQVLAQPEMVLETEPDESDELLGYLVIEATRGTLGEVQEISDASGQSLITVTYNGHELMLPFADELIDRIDHDKREIHYRAPDGLIELYTGS